MRLEITNSPEISVDRDGNLHHPEKHERQGFVIVIDGVEIHFDDEGYAEYLAELILYRNGKLDIKPEPPNETP